MKLKSILGLILAFFALSSAVFSQTTTTTPVAITGTGGGGAAEDYNDQYPMPESFDWLVSPEAMKAYALRQIVSANMYIQGDIISLNDTLNVTVTGGTPNELLKKLADTKYLFSMPDKTKAVQISASMIDGSGWTRLSYYGEVIPTLGTDGYSLNKALEFELREWQPVYLGPGIVSANITSDMGGYSTTQTLWVSQNGIIQIPVSALANKGHLLIVRTEPTGPNTTRNVSYGYEVGTGKSTLMTAVKNSNALTVKNYFELSDNGRPLFLAGSIVPLTVDMRLYKKSTGNGRFASESQPVARVEVTVDNRTVVVRTGITDTTTGQMIEYGRNVKARNAATGEIKVIPMNNGVGAIYLPPGSWDIMYRLDAFSSPVYYGGVG